MAHNVEAGRAGDGTGIAELQLEIEHLRKAVASRDVIGQAKGILMERFKVTADEALRGRRSTGRG